MLVDDLALYSSSGIKKQLEITRQDPTTLQL